MIQWISGTLLRRDGLFGVWDGSAVHSIKTFSLLDEKRSAVSLIRDFKALYSQWGGKYDVYWTADNDNPFFAAYVRMVESEGGYYEKIGGKNIYLFAIKRTAVESGDAGSDSDFSGFTKVQRDIKGNEARRTVGEGYSKTWSNGMGTKVA